MMSFQFFLASHYQRHINCMPSRLKSTVFIAVFRSLMLLMGGLDHLRQTVCNPVFEKYVPSHVITKTTRSHWLCLTVPVHMLKAEQYLYLLREPVFLKHVCTMRYRWSHANSVHAPNCQDTNLFQIQRSSVIAVQYKSHIKLFLMGLLLRVKPCFTITTWRYSSWSVLPWCRVWADLEQKLLHMAARVCLSVQHPA